MAGRRGRKQSAGTAGRKRKRRHARVSASGKHARVQRALPWGEQTFRDLLEAAPDAIVIVDDAGRIVLANAQTEKLFGYGRAELEGQAVEMLIPERFRGSHAGRRSAFFAQPRSRPMGAGLDLHARRKDGSEFAAEISLGPLRGAKGVLVTAAIRDVSERRRIAQDLRASEARLNAIIQSEPECVKVVSPRGDLLEMNRAGLAMLEADALDEVRDGGLLRFITPEYRKAFAELHARVIGGSPGELEFEVIGLKGGRRRLETHAVPLRGDDGGVIALLGITRDVTERRVAEQRLRASERRYRNLFEANPMPMWVRRMADHRYLDVNEAALRTYGYSREEFLQLKTHDLLPEEEREAWDRFQARTDAPWPQTRTGRHRRKDGSVMEVEVTIYPIDYDGAPARLSLVKDVTESRRADRVLREQQYFMQKAQQVAHIGYWLSGPSQSGAALVWSPEAHRIFGISEREFDGRIETFFSLVHPEDLERVKAESLAALAGQRPYRVEHRIVRPDGTVRWIYQEADITFDGEGRPLQMFGVAQDITERKEVELLLRESERRYRYMFEGNPMPMWVRDALGGGFFAVNDAAVALYGYTKEEFLGLGGEDIRPEEERVAWREFFGGRDPMAHTIRRWRHRKKNGEIIDVEVTSQGFHFEGRVARLSLVKDITEQVRAERALRESEERFRAAFEQAAVGMALRGLDPRNPRWLRVNQKLCDILGYERDELLRLTSVDLTPPEERELATDYNEQMLRGELASYTREKRYLRKDGKLIWADISLTVVRGPDGRPVHVLSVIEDITERKRVEEALRESEERSRSLIEMSPSPILLRQGDLVTFANPAALRFFGATRPEDIVDKPYLDLIYPDDHERVRRRMSLIDVAGERTPVEMRRFRRLDGSTVIGETSGVGFPFQGQMLGIVAIHDLTERVKAEQVLAAERNLMRSVLDALLDHVYVKDKEGRYLLMNAATRAARGIPGDAEVVGRTVFDLLAPAVAAQSLVEDKAVVETGEPLINREERIVLPAGEARWLLTTKVPLRGTGGDITGLIGINRDVTEIRLAAEAVQRLNAELEQRVAERTRQLEQANQELESFAYSVSHDLRAPLRSIDGFSKALLEDYESRFDEEGRDYLRRVRRATQRMAALIDDLLGLSRVGRVEMRSEDMDLAALAQEIVDDLRRQEPDRDLEVTIEPGLAAHGDPSLLRIVLQNLLQNAWKFTSRTAAARIEVGRHARNGRDTFFVRDNGVGFDMAYASKLFGAFQRLHADTEFPGTGIGLATVQRIIRRHEGEVDAEAAVGRGATIFFTLGTGAPARGRPERD